MATVQALARRSPVVVRRKTTLVHGSLGILYPLRRIGHFPDTPHAIVEHEAVAVRVFDIGGLLLDDRSGNKSGAFHFEVVIEQNRCQHLEMPVREMRDGRHNERDQARACATLPLRFAA